jgi:predicted nucleic acid-binding protein
MGIELITTDPGAVLRLPEQYRLTAYDASYLRLAQQMNAELVTLDRQLARAARLQGV